MALMLVLAWAWRATVLLLGREREDPSLWMLAVYSIIK
jgi:hypothetical protein